MNSSIILPFSELMEQEPRHHLVLNCLHGTFVVEQLPIHFLRVSRRKDGVPVSDVILITYQIHLDETKLMSLLYIQFSTFLLKIGS